MVRAPESVMTQNIVFINDKLIKGTVKCYNPTDRNKLQAGIENVKKGPKVEDVLKEDWQAFDTFIPQARTVEEALQYPITSLPLSTLDGDFRKSEKPSLRSFFIHKSNATINKMQQKASWLTDGLL